MALRIRLARGGTKKRPHYNIVIADSRNPARWPLHREDRLLQSAAAVGSCRPPEAGPGIGQGLDRQGRRRVRPRAQVPGQCRPGEGARAQQSAEGPAQEEGAGTRAAAAAAAPRPRKKRRRLNCLRDVLLAAVIGAQGLKGEVKVKTFTAAPDALPRYGALHAQGRHASSRSPPFARQNRARR